MKILVTGCAGFIGYHLCCKLLNSKKKFEVLGVDNINSYYDIKDVPTTIIYFDEVRRGKSKEKVGIFN